MIFKENKKKYFAFINKSLKQRFNNMLTLINLK